jgi:hypothetical protein
METTSDPVFFEGQVVEDRIITEDPSITEARKRSTLIP